MICTIYHQSAERLGVRGGKGTYAVLEVFTELNVEHDLKFIFLNVLVGDVLGV